MARHGTKGPGSQLGPLADFRNFLWLTWKHLGLPPPTPLQYDISEWLQHGPDRSITMAFRGIGKSYITSAFCAWTFLRDPQFKIMAVSASKERADQFSTFTRRLIDEIPELQHLRPGEGQRDSRLSFDVGPARPDHSPSLKSVGITGQLTGSRANLIVPDDVEVPKNSETQGQRDKLKELVKEFDAVLKPGGIIRYLGTPQTEMTLYAELLQRGYECRVWPARYPTRVQIEAYGDNLAPFITAQMEKGAEAGTTTETARFTDDDLAKRELSYGKAGFALQFMLDPKLSDVDRYPLKLSNLIVMDCPEDLAPGRVVWGGGPDQAIKDLPNVGLKGDKWNAPWMVTKDPKEWAPYQTTVMFIDPAGGGADEASYAVVSFLNGKLFLRAVGGYQHGFSPETLKGFATVAKELKVNLIRVEDNFGDGMFRALLQPALVKAGHACALEGVKHTRQKELRILDTLEPVIAGHKLIVDPSVIQHDYQSVNDYPPDTKNYYRLFYQMTRVTRERGALRQDGRLDALSGAVAFFTDRMAVDEDEKAEAMRQAALDEELRKLIEACGGNAGQGDQWVKL